MKMLHHEQRLSAAVTAQFKFRGNNTGVKRIYMFSSEKKCFLFTPCFHPFSCTSSTLQGSECVYLRIPACACLCVFVCLCLLSPVGGIICVWQVPGTHVDIHAWHRSAPHTLCWHYYLCGNFYSTCLIAYVSCATLKPQP